MVKMPGQVNNFDAVYSEVFGGRFTLHAQAGFSDQQALPQVSASRLATNYQISTTTFATALACRCFNSGVSDVFPAEPTARSTRRCR